MTAERAQQDPHDQSEGRQILKRRGLMAAAALVAGIVAKQTAQPVAASQSTADNFVAISGGDAAFWMSPSGTYGYGVNVWGTGAGVFGSGVGTSGIGVRGDGAGSDPGVRGKGGDSGGYGVLGMAGGANGVGVRGNGVGTGPGTWGVGGATNGAGVLANGGGPNGNGVEGNGIGAGSGIAGGGGATSGFGVLGTGGGPNGTGTRGNGTGQGAGVYGLGGAASGYGVQGLGGGPNGTGVRGDGVGAGSGVYGGAVSGSITKGVYGHHTSNGYGVYGDAGDGGYGVTGVATTAFGVVGQSGSGTGVYGSTATGLYGVYGIAGSHQGAGGVVGVATVAGTIGFAGAAFAPATDAGYFTGNVSVFGNFAVSGSKFAVVKGGDGKYRGMYAVESPECWFEDFGTGTLTGGKADVKLDPLFAQHVHTDSYHVFLTEHDQNSSLHVTGRTTAGFAVQADEGAVKAKGKQLAAVSGTFSYRVVAKRNDIKGERLPVWEMPTPAFTKPEPPPLTQKP
jgi:hypothetical protein